MASNNNNQNHHDTTATTITTTTGSRLFSSTNDDNNKKLVIVIAGPTATGKSDVAAQICQRRQGIIVSADSVQAYRGVQIGANKPTPEERQRTPHLLIDIADHLDNYNAAEWRQDALFAIEKLSSPIVRSSIDSVSADDDVPKAKRRQNQIINEIKDARQQKGYSSTEPLLPVVCGGTMMYLQWLVHGIPDAMRPSKTAVTKAIGIIEGYQTREDYKGAVEYVASLGPIFANRTTTFCGEDWYRLRRTLEVALTVKEETNVKKRGQLIETLYTGERQDGLLSMNEEYDVRCFFLCPTDRMNHCTVVDKRCEQMILRGLVKETAQLTLQDQMPDMASRAIGYRQTLDYLMDPKLCSPQSGKEGFGTFLQEFTTVTRRYAKKQMSWFRKDSNFMFIPVDMDDDDKTSRVDKAASMIETYCNLSKAEFQQQLTSDDGESSKCRDTNTEQGKGMKFYQYHTHLLTDGTTELDNAVEEAVEWGIKLQQHQKQGKEQQAQQRIDEDSSSRKRKAVET